MVDEVQTYQGEGVHSAGEPTHVHEMIAKVEEPIQTFDNEDEMYSRDESRPEWLPEKFSSAEELAQAYNSLERQFHSSSEERQQQAEQQRFQDEEVPAIQETSPSQVQQILDEIDISLDEFRNICDRYTNRKLFKCDRKGNLIRDKKGNLIKINYDNID